MPSRMRAAFVAVLIISATALLVLGAAACDPFTAKIMFSPLWGDTDRFFDFPFPSDLRTTDEGRPDISGFPDNDNGPARYYLKQFSRILDGFGLSAAVYFRSTHRLDEASFPTPAESTEPESSIFLIDVDPESPHRGERIPLLVDISRREGKYRPKNLVALLPYPGFPMREATLYAAVITTDVLDRLGRPVGPAPLFEALLAGEHGEGPFMTSATALYEPIFDYLEVHEGVARDRIASATVFRTQDATSGLFRLRDKVHEVGLLGMPEVETVSEDENFWAIEGRYPTPSYQAGRSPFLVDGGGIVFDDEGEPVLQGVDWAGYALTIPKQLIPPDGGWPVVVYAHGTGGYASHMIEREGIRVPEVLASRGIATICFDQPLHGIRNPVGVDMSIFFFNFVNLEAWIGNVWQAAADVVYLMRILKVWEIGPTGPGIDWPVRFDADRRMFMGHSQGSSIGVPYLAMDDAVDGAVLSGPGGCAYYSLLYKTKPLNIPLLLKLALDVLDTGELDIFHPILALAQTFIDPADSENLGRYIIRESPYFSKDVFLTVGLVDDYVPPPMADALATSLCIDQSAPAAYPIEGLELCGRGVVEPPIEGNLTGVFGEPVTGAITQYPDNGHYAIFESEEAVGRYAAFFESLAEEGLARIE